jgi:hypothetical protein
MGTFFGYKHFTPNGVELRAESPAKFRLFRQLLLYSKKPFPINHYNIMQKIPIFRDCVARMRGVFLYRH